MAQVASSVLMIRPVNFGFDEETSMDNFFQNRPENMSDEEIRRGSQEEFDNYVTLLSKAGVSVTVIEDTPEPVKRDAVFPDGWISFHEEAKKIIIYPIMAPCRRTEKRSDLIQRFSKALDWEVIDLSHFEKENKFLEGNASIIMDRVSKVAYVCISKRANREVLEYFCQILGYTAVPFVGAQEVKGQLHPLYHTNVILSIGEKIAVLCAEVIKDPIEREVVISSLRKAGKDIVFITEAQLRCYVANCLQLHTANGKTVMVMSTTACNSLTKEQLGQFSCHGDILQLPLEIIERVGGGSARCMLVELYGSV